MTLSVSRKQKFRSAIVSFFGKTVSYPRAAVIMVGLVVLVSCVAVPLKVTVDGIFYVASAKSLFTSDFASNYAWFREPGYPIVLRTLRFFGSDGLYIVLAQAVFLGLAAFIALYVVRRSLGQPDVTVTQLVITLILALNPMYLIYSALVLQQALFALQLALFVLGVSWAWQRPAWLPRYALIILVFLNYFTAIWTSIGWIYLALVPVTLTVILSLWPTMVAVFRRAARTASRVVLGLVAVTVGVALFALVYGSGLQVYSGWTAFKDSHAKNVTIPTSVIEPLTSVPRIPTVGEMTGRMLALMHMGVVDPYIQENDLFLRQQMIPDRAVAEWDTAYVNEPFTRYAEGYITLPNPSNQVHFLYAQAARVAPEVYSAVFVGFIAAGILALAGRKWRLLIILAIPVAFLAVYAASNSPIDRYGIPAYPWAAASVSLLVSWLGGWLRARRVRGKLE